MIKPFNRFVLKNTEKSMKKKKLALNLSKTSIQLLLAQDDSRWQVIGSANPGSADINKELFVLKNQASALCGKKPIVDVLLPKELILSQTIIVEDNISVEDCKKIIADRCGLNTHELYVAIGKSSTRRTLPVAAITVKSIGETRNFVKNKGFLPNRFIAADKLSGFQNPPVFIKDKTNWQALDFDSTTTLKITAAISMFLFFGFLFSLGSTILEYREKLNPYSFLFEIEKLIKLKKDNSPGDYQVVKNIKENVQAYQSPLKMVNLTPQMAKPEMEVKKLNYYEVVSNKYLFSEKQKKSAKMIRNFSTTQFNRNIKELSLESFSYKNLSEIKELEINNIESLMKGASFTSITKSHNHPFVEDEIEIVSSAIDHSSKGLQLESSAKVIGLQKLKNTLKNFNISPYKQLTHQDYKNILIEEVFTDISLSKISIKADTSRASVLPAIFSLSVKPIIFKTTIDSTDYQEIGTPTVKKSTLGTNTYQNRQGLETIVALHSKFEISKDLQKKFRRKDEFLGDLSTAFFLRSPLALSEKTLKEFRIVEKWTDNYPYSKPSIIDLIRVVDDPTKSSGAITYVELPPRMPQTVIALKKVNPSSIKNLTIKTKPPNIPKRSSIAGNSTLKNIIELNRTNLIGVFGKRNGRIALIRLASGSMIRVGVGQKFGEGWQVLSIDLDKIHISNGKRQETLRIPG